MNKNAKWRNEHANDVDKAFIDKHRSKLLIEIVIMLNSEKPSEQVNTGGDAPQHTNKPMSQHTSQHKSQVVMRHTGDESYLSKMWGPNTQELEGDISVRLNNDQPEELSGDTFVNGSCAKIQEDDSLTQSGYAVVSATDIFPDTQTDLRENHDKEVICECKNTNNIHDACTDWCAEHMGFYRACIKQRPNQNLLTEEPRQALYSPLLGDEQSTPCAELYAIFKAVVFGRSPQRIICDHLNHVNAHCNWRVNGCTSFLNPDTPNVDIWRRIHEAIII